MDDEELRQLEAREEAWVDNYIEAKYRHSNLGHEGTFEQCELSPCPEDRR